ncbi:MmgE/PrpD family protein [Novosphingobium sp. NBM11]|uniref:MmgE/PrpD family protein n=1 Tax=Novosphingobium sp. NBM11 TaxID=2596914 RepID=UPI002105F84E|nr:MmgE/PrpD family protein [Novosphingobium sp. NBM11]
MMASPETGISDMLTRHIAAMRWEGLPDDARAAAARACLDATGVIYAARGLAHEAQPFVTLAARGGEGPCSILGTGIRAMPVGAALANGALAHAVDYEDAFDRAPAHPNASLVPVLLALAQSEGPVDGRRFLTALAVGGDIACRMALSLRQPMEEGGWYPPPIVAAYGAAAGAANLLGLNAAQVKDALSMVLCQATMPGEIKHSRTTVLRAVREAFPAQAALTAVLLAREGVAGFEAPLEGRAGFYALYAGGAFSADDLADRLGTHFWGTELTFKPWPSCRGTHPFIEMALDLRGRHGFAPAAVAGIDVEVDEVQHMLVDPLERKQAPAVAIDAKFSIPFTTALALTKGGVGLDDFGADTLADQQVLALSALVRPRIAKAPAWQRGTGGAMGIRLHDGTFLEAMVPDALGCPARPLPPAAQHAKFVDCLAHAALPRGREQAEHLVAAILTLDRCEDVGSLFV